jgi:hypothetical protein
MATMAQRLAALEAEVAQLRQQVLIREQFLDILDDRAYQRGRESVLGRQAEPRSPGPRHLQFISGGAQ